MQKRNLRRYWSAFTQSLNYTDETTLFMIMLDLLKFLFWVVVYVVGFVIFIILFAITIWTMILLFFLIISLAGFIISPLLNYVLPSLEEATIVSLQSNEPTDSFPIIYFLDTFIHKYIIQGMICLISIGLMTLLVVITKMILGFWYKLRIIESEIYNKESV